MIFATVLNADIWTNYWLTKSPIHLCFAYWFENVAVLWRERRYSLTQSRRGGGGGGILTYSLGGGVPLGSQKSYPVLLEYILQILWP